ncbi:RusA family crossover junction endodeoxyribonuclease [Pediococcus acidilactici]|uniref:RusA family crossover junction endodeoxyribonuclease n=1 Tax=Pediococcus acidilactici TaxID=1254 RepID=UPI0001BEDDB7|nr:RusA family crossover junction endodeoxyribonuclease [Pediococcus acidilactici]EFA26061.1 crossover junction endodeoxyribonuclease RusA [Pediococcus acidilactici 7_4]QDJ22656.1 RusA family crossover junction endodeoxyribonuclease [Pediococcus acidilactici]
MIKLRIDGEPVPQGRPKFVSRGKFVSAYDPPKSKTYKKLVAQSVREQYHGEPLDCPLYVVLNVFRPVQKSISKAERARKLSGVHRPTVKPDLDNYYKAVTDACTGIIWRDDALIVNVKMGKYYSEEPRVEMEVQEL